MLGMKGRRYKLCEKVVELRRVSDSVTTFVVVFEEHVLRLICGHAPQCRRSFEGKQYFHDELKCEWDIHSSDDLVTCLGDSNGLVGRHIDGFDRVHGR